MPADVAEGDQVFNEAVRQKLASVRTSHTRFGAILLALGLLVGVLLPFFWGAANDLGKGAMIAGVFLLGGIGGWALGMATYGWILSKAKWGSDYFPLE